MNIRVIAVGLCLFTSQLLRAQQPEVTILPPEPETPVVQTEAPVPVPAVRRRIRTVGSGSSQTSMPDRQ
jgi:hypothetical protein